MGSLQALVRLDSDDRAMGDIGEDSGSAPRGHCFPLAEVAAVIRAGGYLRVVLQFPDEHLGHCVDVYTELQSQVNGAALYIAADSTYGSSVDDVSAQHVNSDLLVFFGSDLSSSGAMPVLTVPPRVEVDVDDLRTHLLGAMEEDERSGSLTRNVLVLYEPGCHGHVSQRVVPLLAELFPAASLRMGALPPCADFEAWKQRTTTKPPVAPSSTSINTTTVGGLVFSSEDLTVADSIIYIGDKKEQLDNILLHLAELPLLSYSPHDKTMNRLVGSQTKVFRQRFIGVEACASAKIIGIIVGSMGLTGESTREIMNRLQQLIEAAGKKHYTFVMGRLNEAKICNFPEIDLFCFVSNEDTAVIAPKTFDKPVVTPWELELGLGARSWSSSYQSSPTAITRDMEDLPTVLQRVRAARPEGNGIDEEEEAHEEDAGQGGIDGEGGKGTGAVILQGSRALAVFHSAAGDLLKQREYQGLVPHVDEGQSTDLLPGLHGVAAGYERKVL